jgi:hypothetical protein
MSSLRLSRAAFALPALVAMLAVTGCSASVSTSKTLKTDQAETQIEKGLDKQTGDKVTVACPKNVKAKKNGTFKCTATGSDGSKGTISVIQKDDNGNIAWKLN